MSEQFADVGPVTLCYETFGDPTDPALLLIMGLGTQMIAWRDDFCEQLAARGFHVIRYDNRDTGRSTSMKGRPPTLTEMITRRIRKPAYSLGDLADDGARLLDHLGIERAHVVGASMGGMIAQQLAIGHPLRVLSLTSIMSTVGGRIAGAPRLSILPLFLSRPADNREAYIKRAVALFRKVGSPDYFDEDGIREIAELSWERGINNAGTGRQLAAIMADGNRSKRLAGVRVPTLVIHGTADKLVTPSGGRATAKAIPGAKLMKVKGMGHDLPRTLWPRLIDAIAENTERAESGVVASAA
jgi:pimeloyl-ACP methyl ester carboxylesterase